MAKKRNYKNEYENYQGSPEQIKRRSMRNQARAKLMAAGKVKKGDGKDVAHANGNPKDNSMHNLKVQSKSANRSFPRTKAAKKRNPKD